MARKKTEGLTERETEILSILWEQGALSVGAIRSHMQNKPLVNTVRTLLNIMEERDLVMHDGKEYGRKYSAKAPRERTQATAVRKLIDSVFAGSAQELVLCLTDNGEVDVEELKAVYELAKRRKEKKSS